MAEVSRFGPLRMAVDQLGVTGDDQQRREPRGNDVGLPHVIVLEVELVELAHQGHCVHANTERELRCTVFSQNLSLRKINAR